MSGTLFILSKLKASPMHADIQLELMDNSKNISSGELQLEESMNNTQPFERGQLDVFHVFGKPFPAAANQLKLWRNNKGRSPDWFVQWISVKAVSTDRTLYFRFDRWLKSEEPVLAYVPHSHAKIASALYCATGRAAFLHLVCRGDCKNHSIYHIKSFSCLCVGLCLPCTPMQLLLSGTLLGRALLEPEGSKTVEQKLLPA
jgi:hypothetical protein